MGNFEIWFDVPESLYGDHYLWVRSASTGDTDLVGPLQVLPHIESSSNSGQTGDNIDVDMYGHSSEEESAMLYVDSESSNEGTESVDSLPVSSIVAEILFTGDASIKSFSGTVSNYPVQPGSFNPTPDGGNSWIDNGDGTIDTGG